MGEWGILFYDIKGVGKTAIFEWQREKECQFGTNLHILLSSILRVFVGIL